MEAYASEKDQRERRSTQSQSETAVERQLYLLAVNSASGATCEIF